MFEFWLEPWFWPAVAVVVGLPISLLVLTEVHSALLRKGSRAANIILLVRNFVVPVGALLLLLNQATYAEIDLTWTQVIATVFGFLVILVLLNSLNFAVFVSAREGTWRSRIPSIFVDIARVILILICLALLFWAVWGADIGGLFAALGIGSIVIGLALQNAVGGVVSGLLLLFERPFELGDWLVVDGIRGRVVEVNWRAVHIRTPSGVHIVPNASLAGSTFLNLTRSVSPFETDLTVRFATDDPPQEVIDTCTLVAAGLPFAVADAPATVTPLPKAKYLVEIPIQSPSNNAAAIRLFHTRLWYAARRGGLHLDRDLSDNFNTPTHVREALDIVAPALYLSPEQEREIMPLVRIERWGAGEVMQRVATPLDGMRYIISGTASAATPIGDGEVVFAVLDIGEVVGLNALTRQGAATTITANDEVVVLFVPTELLDRLARANPKLAKDIGQAIDNRRTLARAKLAALGIEVPKSARLFS